MAGKGFKIADAYVEIHGEVDGEQIRRQAHRTGNRAGDSFNRGFFHRGSDFAKRFRTNLLRAIPTNWITFLPIVSSLTVALAGLAAAAVALGGSLGLALAGFAAIIPAGIAVVGTFLFLKNVFRGLTEEGKNASKAYAEFKKGLDQARDSAVKFLREPFDEFFQSALTLMPIINGYFRGMAKIMADVFDETSKLMRTPLFQGKLKSLVDELLVATRQWGKAMAPLANIIVTLGDAAAPIFTRFSRWIRRIITDFSEFLNLKHETGELQRFLMMAGDELAKWGRILGNFIMGLGNVFAAASEPGRRLASSLEEISQKFRAWSGSEKGRRQVKNLLEFFINLDYKRIFQVAAAITAVGIAIKAMAGVGSIVQGILGLLALGPVGAIIAGVALALGLLAGAFVWAYTTSDTFREKVNNAFRWIKDNIFPILASFRDWLVGVVVPALKEVWAYLEENVKPALDRLKKAWEDNEEQLKTFGGWIKWLAEQVIPLVIMTLGGFVTALVVGVISAIEVVITVIGWFVRAVEGIGTAFTWLKTTTQAVWTIIGTIVSTTMSTVGGIISGTWRTIRTIVTNAATSVRTSVSNAWNSITTKTGDLRSKVTGVISGTWATVRTLFKSALNAVKGAVSNAWGSVKSNTSNAWASIRSTISSRWSSIKSTVSNALSNVKSAISNAWSAARSKTSSAWSSIVSAVRNKIQDVLSTIRGLPGRIRSALGNLGGLLAGAGRALIRGLINGITGMIGSLRAKLRSITNMLPSWKGPEDTDRKILKPAGRAVMQGFMGGIDEEIPALRSTLQDLTRALPGMATQPSGPVNNFAAGSVVLDASNLRSVADLIAMLEGVQSTARQFGARSPMMAR